MKFLVVLALFAAVASAKLIKPSAVSDQMAEIKDIIAAINDPSTHPDTAAALQQMLEELLASANPAIVDGEYEPISVGPAIVDGEYEDISVGPAIVDESVVGASSPLVQIIINVKPNSGSPVIRPDPVDFDDIFGPPAVVHDDDEPSPIIVVDKPDPKPEPQPEPLPEVPVVVLPGILN